MKLFEGMWANDLEDLIQPLVSIDEYESKIDEDAIAIGFYINDKEAADDLNRFIQKSAVPLIDSDVSPAPDQRGYYIVFAELSANDRFVENLCHLCEEVGQIGAITEWQMKMRGFDKVMPFDAERINKGLIRNRITDRLTTLRTTLDALKGGISGNR